MKGFIVGKKSKSEAAFDEKGKRIVVTHIITRPCRVIDVKYPQRDGYTSILLGWGGTKKIQKSRAGILKKAGIKDPLRFFREIRLDKKNGISFIEKEGKQGIKVGQHELFAGSEITPSLLFAKNDPIVVTGVSKGKGFQGVVRRHRFKGGPRTHGQSDRERAPGSIGQTTTPGRVYKGKRMAGRMGGDTVTVKGLRVVEAKDDELVVAGLVPGAQGGVITVISHESYF